MRPTWPSLVLALRQVRGPGEGGGSGELFCTSERQIDHRSAVHDIYIYFWGGACVLDLFNLAHQPSPRSGSFRGVCNAPSASSASSASSV